MHSLIEIQGNKKHIVCVFCPVGDLKFIPGFLSGLKKQTFQDFDLFLIYRKDLVPIENTGYNTLSAIEDNDYGTSGVFYLGQSYAYAIGYEFIILADIDAVLESENLIAELVEACSKDKKVHVPMIYEPNYVISGTGNPNGYGCIHRSTFEKIGFSNPFFYRGGEDWDFTNRIRKNDLYVSESHLKLLHPMSGIGIFNDLSNSSKYFSYFSNGLKSYLIGYRSIKDLVRYSLEFTRAIFYSFAFRSFGLAKAVFFWWSFKRMKYVREIPPFSITNEITKGAPGKKNDQIILFELLTSGKSITYTTTISSSRIQRFKIALCSLLGLLALPFAFIFSFICFIFWQFEKKNVILLATPANILQVRELMEKMAQK